MIIKNENFEKSKVPSQLFPTTENAHFLYKFVIRQREHFIIIVNKKIFQLKTTRALVNRCTGYIVTELVGGDGYVPPENQVIVVFEFR